MTAVITPGHFLLCMAAALAAGLILALGYTYRSRYTKSFVMTLALLPAVVCVVIMMVNGDVGAGVAVAGAFSLVRFRSAAGSAKEICFIFLSMAIGLATGMGYVGVAAILFVLLALVLLVLQVGRDLGPGLVVPRPVAECLVASAVGRLPESCMGSRRGRPCRIS
jgi:hypothetical protein